MRQLDFKSTEIDNSKCFINLIICSCNFSEYKRFIKIGISKCMTADCMERNFAKFYILFDCSHQKLGIMPSPMLTIFLIAVMLAANVSGQNGLLGPPNRPGDLKNPGVLNNYLKALNEYQDALSRPR